MAHVRILFSILLTIILQYFDKESIYHQLLNFSFAVFPPGKAMPKLPDFPRGLADPSMLPPALRFGAAAAAAAGVPTSLASALAAGSPAVDPAAAAAAAAVAAAAVGGGGGDSSKPNPILDPLAHARSLMKVPPGSSSPGATAAGLGALMAGAAGAASGAAAAAGVPPAPSLYEMAALTHELDTQVVTTKVKEVLLANNVGQKVLHTLMIFVLTQPRSSKVCLASLGVMESRQSTRIKL